MTYYPPKAQDGVITQALRNMLGSETAEEGEDLDATLAFAARDLVEAIYAMSPSKRPEGWNDKPQGENMAMPEGVQSGHLWSVLDWALWGNGMADVFREPLADKMVACLTAEERRKAEELIERWHTLKGESAAEQAQTLIKALTAKVQKLEDALLLADPDLKASLEQLRRGETAPARTAAEETGLALGRLTEQDMDVTREQLRELGDSA